MRLTVVTHNYPTEYQPEMGAFTHAAVQVMRQEVEAVDVIAPISGARIWAWRLSGSRRHRLAEKDRSVRRPRYISISSRLVPWRSLGNQWTVRNYRRVVHRELIRTRPGPDHVYAHFFLSGWAALPFCQYKAARLVVNMGESSLDRMDAVYGAAAFRRSLAAFSGIVAVSRDIQERLLSVCPEIEERIIHLPNAINLQKFHPHDKAAARSQLNLPAEVCIAAFCGHFIERKGPLRVLAALNQLGGAVKGVFLGQGPQFPNGPHVLHSSSVPHDELPVWFGAADIFVLPSLAEGMCNAILEAMASGLPVVVSDRPFNTSFVDHSCACLVDPQSVMSIADALARLQDNEALRRRLGDSALERSRNHCLHHRVERILDFMKRLSPVEDRRK